METQALAQIPEITPADGPVVCLSNIVKVYKAGDMKVSAIKRITFSRQRFSMIVGPSGMGRQPCSTRLGDYLTG